MAAEKEEISSGEMAMIDGFIMKIKQGKFARESAPSIAVATECAKLFRGIIGRRETSTKGEQVVAHLRHVGAFLAGGSFPFRLIVENITRRILFIVRLEYEGNEAETPAAVDTLSSRSLSTLPVSLTQIPEAASNTLTRSYSLIDVSFTKGWKHKVMQHLSDYIVELGEIHKQIIGEAKEHIYANETILTYGHSHLVDSFLKQAAKKVKFEVYVAEAAPGKGGRKLAASLAEAGIKTHLIPDSSVYAIMSRVSKVFCGTNAILADGGILTVSGGHGVGVCAHLHRVPLVAICGLHKLTPVYPVDPQSLMVGGDPTRCLGFPTVERGRINQLHVVNPEVDYIPPNLINCVITNNGTHNPSYIYRLMHELYNREDYEL